VNPSNGTALIVGNGGTVLLLDGEGNFKRISVPTFENLRAVSWDPSGSVAIIAGNNGTLLKYSPQGVEGVDDGRANLRDISWRPKSNTALIASNCFAEEFIPSPNLLSYEAETNVVKPLNEGRADLIGVDWKPTGESALVVGYDVVWHNGFIGNFDGTALSSIQFDNKRVYPVAVAWEASAKQAAIVTATGQLGTAKGTVFLWDGRSLKLIYSDDEFFFSDVAWTWKNSRLAALASAETRTFNS
jgi:WD40 repeat protein